MHNYCREFFDSRGRVGHESLVKDTGVQRPLIVGNLAGPYCYPNSFKLADDACIVQGTILLINASASSTRDSCTVERSKLPIQRRSKRRDVDIAKPILSRRRGRAGGGLWRSLRIVN